MEFDNDFEIRGRHTVYVIGRNTIQMHERIWLLFKEITNEHGDFILAVGEVELDSPLLLVGRKQQVLDEDKVLRFGHGELQAVGEILKEGLA